MAQRVLFGGDSGATEKGETSRKEELDFKERRMKTRYGEVRRRDTGVPHACDCGAAIHVAKSSDPNTMGRLYFSCPYEVSEGPGKGCGFRRWWIPALCDEFEKIKEDNYEMRDELEAAKKQIEDHEATIFALELQCDELKGAMEKFGALEMKFEELEEKYHNLDMYL